MKITNLVLNNFKNDSRVLKTSNTLQNLGHEVTVVAMHEEGLAINETLNNGVKVHRIHLATRKWSKHRLVQIIKLLEYIFKFVLNYRKSEILHCNDLNGLFVGVVCKLTKPSLPIIYDSHEFAINDVPNQSKWSIKLKFALEWFLIKFAKQVINVSDSIANEYARLYNIDKPHLVLNCPAYKEQQKMNLFRESLGIREDQVIFLYQGGLSAGRGIETLLEAFSDLETDKNIIVFMGYGVLEEDIKNKANEQKTIFFYPAAAPDVLLNYTSSADYGVLFADGDCFSYKFSLPNKFFEYIMAGLPVLISENLIEMKRLVEQERVGIVAEDNTIDGIENAIQKSFELDYAEIQQNVHAARKKYCWEEQGKVLKEIYSDFIGS